MKLKIKDPYDGGHRVITMTNQNNDCIIIESIEGSTSISNSDIVSFVDALLFLKNNPLYTEE